MPSSINFSLQTFCDLEAKALQKVKAAGAAGCCGGQGRLIGATAGANRVPAETVRSHHASVSLGAKMGTCSLKVSWCFIVKILYIMVYFYPQCFSHLLALPCIIFFILHPA
jgi:hypothetical protein